MESTRYIPLIPGVDPNQPGWADEIHARAEKVITGEHRLAVLLAKQNSFGRTFIPTENGSVIDTMKEQISYEINNASFILRHKRPGSGLASELSKTCVYFDSVMKYSDSLYSVKASYSNYFDSQYFVIERTLGIDFIANLLDSSGDASKFSRLIIEHEGLLYRPFIQSGFMDIDDPDKYVFQPNTDGTVDSGSELVDANRIQLGLLNMGYTISPEVINLDNLRIDTKPAQVKAVRNVQPLRGNESKGGLAKGKPGRKVKAYFLTVIDRTEGKTKHDKCQAIASDIWKRKSKFEMTQADGSERWRNSKELGRYLYNIRKGNAQNSA